MNGCAVKKVNSGNEIDGYRGEPAAEGVKISDIDESLIRFEGNYGNLLPFIIKNKKILLSDYPIDINTLINTEVKLELTTPSDQLFTLEQVPDLEALIKKLNLDARTGTFVPDENYNTAWCQIPLNIQNNEECYCGFQFEHEKETKIVLIFLTTQRDLDNAQLEPTRIATPPWDK